jgi:hypothetical protein
MRKRIYVGFANDMFFLTDYSGEPRKFHEAYNHPKSDAKIIWNVAICKDF